MRYNSKRDENHPEIVDAFRRFGADVFDAGGVGHGFPDIVVGFRGNTYLAEIKTERGKLKKTQEAFIERYPQIKVHIVRTTDDAKTLLFGGKG